MPHRAMSGSAEFNGFSIEVKTSEQHNASLQVRTVTAPEELAQLAAAAEAERVVYERLKAELRTAAAVLSVLCFAACFGFYGRVIHLTTCDLCLADWIPGAVVPLAILHRKPISSKLVKISAHDVSVAAHAPACLLQCSSAAILLTDLQ